MAEQAHTSSVHRIKVLVVDDSPTICYLLSKILRTEPRIQVIDTAADGQKALELIRTHKPDVVIMDVIMPVMDGLEATRQIMQTMPTPILIVTSSLEDRELQVGFAAIQAGALDVLAKPREVLTEEYLHFAPELIRKVLLVAPLKGSNRFTRGKIGLDLPAPAPRTCATDPLVSPGAPILLPGTANQGTTPSLPPYRKLVKEQIRIGVIGASTGGPPALVTLLKDLDESYPIPLLAIQHISPGFLEGFVSWLGRQTRLSIKIATPGEYARPGTLYFPQENTHLEIDPRGRLSSSNEPEVGGHRPAVTATMNSVAASYGRAALGIILTGMGRDGTDGLKSIYQRGGFTLAQDETSSIVYGMPHEALKAGAVCRVLSINDMAVLLTRLGKHQGPL